jgi:transglutaminase-like putative cysteine protease
MSPSLALVLVLVGAADEPAKAPKLDPALPYQVRRVNPVTYAVDFRVMVTAPYHTKKLKVWLPLPQSDCGQEVSDSRLTTFPADVKPQIGTEKVFGNKFAYFEFDHPEGAQVIRHRFKIKVWELHWDINPAKVVRVESWPSGFDRYLKADHAVAIPRGLDALTRQIVPRSKGPAYDMAAVMGWLEEQMTYDHSRAGLKASSEYALAGRTGHCSDYHGLCAAFGRSLGVPTRVTYGINSFPKNSPSHCKLEAYLAPYGWVSFDVSETQNLTSAIKKAPGLSKEKKAELVQAANKRLLRGFRDNTWYLQTRGTDYELAPPAKKKVPVVRTIYAEADGVALPDPDPANLEKHEFSWATAHRYKADRTVVYPFKNWDALKASEK